MVPNDSSPTRRALLRRGTAAVVTSVTATTAGCTSALPPLGSAQRFGRIDVPDADPPRYREWLPAPGAVEALDNPHYAYLLRRPGELDYPAPVRFTTPRKRLLAELDHFGVGYANYDRLLATDLGTVIEADFDPATVAETLADGGYAPTGSYGGFDLFARDDVSRRTAVGEEAIVWSSERVHALPAVDALIDARAGRVDRYHEADAGVERVTDAIGESRMVEYVPPSDERYWQKCEGFRFDGTTAYHLMVFLYPEGRTPPESELRERAVSGTVLTREVENSDFRIDGRLVTVEGRIPPGRGIDPADIDPPYPPQVTWGYRRDPDAPSVTLHHEVGEEVPTSALGYQFEADVPSDWLVLAEERPLPTDAETLGPGDAVTAPLPESPTVSAIPYDAVDHEAAEPRPVTRLELLYGPGETRRPVFGVPLEGSS